MPIKDSLIAATAMAHGLAVATRNRIDFAKAGGYCRSVRAHPATPLTAAASADHFARPRREAWLPKTLYGVDLPHR